MKTLTFHTFAEKRPDHGQEVFTLHVSSFYGTVEARFATVEYTWLEVDEDGKPTGDQVLYDPADGSDGSGVGDVPEGCVLGFMLTGDGWRSHNDHDLWCPASDVDAITLPVEATP